MTKEEKMMLIALVETYLEQRDQGMILMKDHVDALSRIRIKLIEEIKKL